MTNSKGYKKIPVGGIITEAGNSAKYKTGDWRAKPIWNEEGCVHCLMCWVFCPDNAIKTEDGKMVGITTTTARAVVFVPGNAREKKKPCKW